MMVQSAARFEARNPGTLVASTLIALLPGVWADLSKVVAANLARNGLRGVTKLVIAGALAPRGMGVLRSVYAIFKLLTAAVDLGLNHALLSLAPAATARGDAGQADRIVKSVFGLRIVTAAGFLVAGAFAAGPIARWVLGDPALTGWVLVAFAAASGQTIWKFVSGHLSAAQRFDRLALFLITAPLLMLAAVSALAALGRLGLGAAIVVYLCAQTVAVALWWPWVDRSFLRAAWSAATVRRVARFGGWVYLSRLATTSRSQLNPLLLKHPRLSGSLAAGETSAGLYAFGDELADELTVLSESLYMVLMPRAGAKTSPAALRGFVRRCYRNLAWLLVPLTIPLFLFRPFVTLLGRLHPVYLEYLPSANVFVVLYATGLLSLAMIPLRSALYALERPRVDSYLETAGVVLLIAGSIAVIPRYGYVGAALVALAVRVVVLVGLTAYGVPLLRRLGSAP